VKRPGYIEALTIKEELENIGDGTADSLVDELTERGACFRFTHRWPMLIQLVYAMDKEKLTRSALLKQLRYIYIFLQKMYLYLYKSNI
jgi:hypothetical protein